MPDNPLTDDKLSSLFWEHIESKFNVKYAELYTYMQSISASNNKQQITTLHDIVSSLNTRIELYSDVLIDVNLIIPKTTTIAFNGFKFIKNASKIRITYNGNIEAGRYQIFSGFDAGEIRGNFNSQEIYPEWWGLVDNKHQDAINAAIRSRLDTQSPGNIISLAAGEYYISAPIDLIGSYSVLQGAGAGRTKITASDAFPWPLSAYYDNAIFGPSSHTAMIWMGGNYSQEALKSEYYQTFNTGVKGITLNAFYATWQYGGPSKGKFVSGISSQGYIEENSFIHNVNVNYAGGFGFGFAPISNATPIVLNGLEIRDFWITGPISVSSIPIYLPETTNNAIVEMGTIDMRLDKSISVVNSALNIPPSYFPEIAIQVDGGKTYISNIHIEGTTIGIRISTPASAPSYCYVNSVDVNWMCDYDAVYFDNPSKTGNNMVPPPLLTTQIAQFPSVYTPTSQTQIDPHLRKYSTAILIAKNDRDLASMGTGWSRTHGAKNYNSRVVLNNIRAIGNVRYILRDPAYNIHISSFGQGDNVGYYASYYGGITFYARGVAVPVINNIKYDSKGNAILPIVPNFTSAAGNMSKPAFSYWNADTHKDRQYYQLII